MAQHGLGYDEATLATLEPLSPGSSIRKLSATDFSRFHLDHILSHPPDEALFPFLHGLEGDNEAQNMFFASAGQTVTVAGTGKRQSIAPVPRYRGLVWVTPEEDLLPSQRALLSKPSSEQWSYSDDDDYDFDDSEDDDLLDDGEASMSEHDRSNSSIEGPPSTTTDMDIDVEVVDNAQGTTPDSPHSPQVVEIVGIGTDASHMHPVQHRAIPIVKPIQTANLASSLSSSNSSAASSSEEPYNFFEHPDSSTMSSPSSSKPSSPHPLLPPSKSTTAPNLTTPTRPRRRPSPVAPILTSTFREQDLIRHVSQCQETSEDGVWEFLPIRVPDGISLRNFGIQVPILATLSDIVIYSPTPRGAAYSANAIRLAERFVKAIERKRRERCVRLGLDENGFRPGGTQEELLRYNVFILNASAEELGDKLPHLAIRMYRSGEVPGSLGATKAMHGGLGMDMDVEDANHSLWNKPNTVNFAQRERDEMRDLTKASEIISILPSNVPPLSPDHEGAMPELRTTATHFDPIIGQVFLGNCNDVPVPSRREREVDLGIETSPMPSLTSSVSSDGFQHIASHANPPTLPILPAAHPLNFLTSNNPNQGFGYDMCIECLDVPTFPSQAMLKAADEQIDRLEELWVARCDESRRLSYSHHDANNLVPPRPPPHANSVVHLQFPSSPPSSIATLNSLMPIVKFLQKCLLPPQPLTFEHVTTEKQDETSASSRRWSSTMTSFIHPFLNPWHSESANQASSTSILTSRSRAYTNPTHAVPSSHIRPRTRPLKILLFSSDGYTESSVPSLCLLMAVKGLTLPEAYLELQVVKRRSFFVYQNDLGILRRVEGRLADEKREKERETQMARERRGSINGNVRRVPSNPYPGSWGPSSRPGLTAQTAYHPPMAEQQPEQPARPPPPRTRPSAKSVSFAKAPPIVQADPSPPPLPIRESSSTSMPIDLPSVHERSPSPSAMNMSSSAPGTVVGPPQVKGRRPRAMTSPWLPSLFGGDHQAWFNDPRFDGSFPSRVLPFLYLGNLAHASNVYMLHALGITHVVSVGECALIPPPNMQNFLSQHESSSHSAYPSQTHFIPSRGGPSNQGSLWMEERAGRIKVLDIQGVCDDGIDTLEPQLDPICQWIDKARREGGQILVHCRVGVSRSATVTIAYVMKHLNLPLVDAYLIVRSRRLSVLIQPNMRLLYNLCGWEIKLAKERVAAAGTDESGDKLRKELQTVLSWPYLAMEVHRLNEKYLH